MGDVRQNDTAEHRRGNYSLRQTLLLVGVVVACQICMMLWMSSSPPTVVVHHPSEKDIATQIALQLPNFSSDLSLQLLPDDLVTPNGVDPNATCDDLTRHFHQINDAFQRGDPSVAPPLINFALYVGQGFGRLVDHSVAHCLLSFALDRPCLVDLSTRDPYYTWRAFVHTGSYDWEFESNRHTDEYQARLQTLATRVQTAVAQMADPSNGEWSAPVPHTPDLHLMEKLEWSNRKTNRQQYWQHIRPWRADRIPKALLSPNWGFAWFPNLQSPAYFGKCHRKEFLTRLQNSMYEPTVLSQKLHRLRRQQVMQGQEQQNQPITDRPYGAIHLRFVIMRIEKVFPKDDEKDSQLAATLGACLRYAQRQTNVTDWWLISDKPSRAIDLITHMSSSSSPPFLDPPWRFYYAPEDRNATVFAEHSNTPTARGMFGHASMSNSILDWMVLHESEAAIVTKGSYGDTGARGRGKFPVEEASGVRPCGALSLYMKRQ